MADDDDDDDDDAEQQPSGRTIGDWTAFQDDESGQTYYYNETTGDSRWDAPPGFDDADNGESAAGGDGAVEESSNNDDNKQDDDTDGIITKSPEFNMGDDPDDVAEDDDDDDDDDDGITRSPPMNNEVVEEEEEPSTADAEEEVVADGEEIGDGWIAYHDAEGRIYYANSETGETQWERPTVAGDAPKQSDGKEATTGAAALSKHDDGQLKEDKEEEQTIDAAAIAEQFLQEQDAIMEESVLEHISTLFNEVGNVAGKKAKQYLVQGYQGDTAMCGLMGLWLAELKSSRAAVLGKPRPNAALQNDAHDKNMFQEGADAARDVVESVVNRIARERFTTNGGDAIMKLTKKQAAFVDEMIKSDRWRKMLIDLSASNKDSKLFMYCLQTISNLGHHREIANRIDQSDYFGVFNSLLRSELSVVGKLAVAGYDGYSATGTPRGISSGQIETLTSELRRTCTTTSYTYLYAMVVLQELIKDAKKSNDESLQKACQKWERLREELEEEMMKPVSTGTTFQRKRRIDVALAMSDLVQRQRRRIDPTSDDANNHLPVPSSIASKNNLADALDSAIVTMLTKTSLGNQVDKDMAEHILKFAYGGSTERIGDLLIKHPFTITTLLRNLFGTKRIRQLETRLKCARLIALAVTASERAARSQKEGTISVSNEDALSQIVLKGSQLCEQAENMVSFTAIDSVEEGHETSTGRQLSAMCIKYPVIAQGALIWAKELASNPDFVTTAAYPTLAPCILCLARIISLHHPLARPAALELTLVFIGHSNCDISHQKMESIKEQCLRLMLLLSAQGLCIEVISAVMGKLQKNGSSELDSALIRYFVSGLLDTVQPPLSEPFCNSFGGLLVERQCVDALKSQHFEKGRRAQLIQLINQIETQAAWTDVQPLLSTVKSVYSAGEVLN